MNVPCDVSHLVEGPEDGAAVVLINSLGADLRMWEPQAKVLAESFRTVRFDARGHGRSPVPPGPYTVDQLGEDVIALLDRLSIERAALCGVSLGGATAVWLAVNFPERVERLAVCFSAPRFGDPQSWLERAASVRSEGMDAVADAVLGRWFTPSFSVIRPDLAKEMRAMLEATSPEGYAGACEALAEIDLRPQLGGIAVPTLVISGADDPATPPAQGRLIAAEVPGAAFAEVPGAAHLGNLEQPELVSSLLLAHFRNRKGSDKDVWQ